MVPISSRIVLSLCALCAARSAAGEGLAPEGSAPLRGSLSSTLYEEALAMRLGLSQGQSFLGLGLDSSEDGAFLEACLDLAPDPDRDFRLFAGPGSASGNLRILVDPTSTTALSPGAPIALDRSLRSRSNVIGLHAGPLSLFGVAEGSGPIAFAARGESEDRSLGSTAGGLSLQIARPDFHLEALASASYADAGVPALGWRPDYYASPALHAARGGEAFAEASLVAEKLREGGSALAAVSGSYGSLAGPALAFRLESREASGPLELRLRAAAANPAFHALFGKCERRLAGAAAEARLAMRRTSSISASVEAEAEGQGLRYAPLWGESAAFKLVLPLGIEADRFFESKLEARRPAEGGRDGSWAIAIKRGRSDEGGAADLDAALSWDAKVENLVVGLSTSLAAEGGVPSLGMELDLELFDQGSSAAPVLAKGGASVVVPWGRAGCLELDVDLPQAGIVLAPAIEGATAPPFSFRLRYKASFTASSALAR